MHSPVGPPDQGGPGEAISLPAGMHTAQNGEVGGVEAQRQEEAATAGEGGAGNQAGVDAGADTVVLPGEAMIVDDQDERVEGDERQSSMLSLTGLKTEDGPGDPEAEHQNQAVEGGSSVADQGTSQEGLNLSEAGGQGGRGAPTAGGRGGGQEGRGDDEKGIKGSRSSSSEGKAKTFAGQEIVSERTFVTNGGQTLRSVRIKSIFQGRSTDELGETNARMGLGLKERAKGALERTMSSGQKSLGSKVVGIALVKKKLKQKAQRVKGQTETINHVMQMLGKTQSSNKISLHRRTEAECKGKYVAVEEPIDSQSFPLLIFHPYTSWRITWDVCVMFLLVYSFVSVPLRLAFDVSGSREECSKDFMQQDPLFYYDVASDFIFLTDMMLTFRTAYFEERSKADAQEARVIITDPKMIAIRYFRGFFAIDLLSSFPLDLVLITTCESIDGAQKLLRGPSAFKIIRLVRVLRLMRVNKLRIFMSKIRDLFHIHPGMMRVIRFFFVVALIMHYNACLFYFIGEMDAATIDNMQHFDGTPVTGPWTRTKMLAVPNSTAVGGFVYKPPGDMTIGEKYVVSLYWSIATMTTVGFGDITPTTLAGIAYCIFVLVQAGVAFSYMVGNMANLLQRINPRLQRFRESMQIWEEFMHRERLPADLRQRIRKHKMVLYGHPVAQLPDLARNNMSKTLLRDVTAHLYRGALHSLPMFKGLDEQTLTDLALALEPMQIAPNTVIYREGELGDSMFFVSQGEVTMSMLIMDHAAKEEQGIHIISDISLRDHGTFHDGDTKSSFVANKHSYKGDDDEIVWCASRPNAKTETEPLTVFKWIISHEGSITFFGEGCLTTRGTALRKATAMSRSWCTVFRLDKAALQHVASKSPNMALVFRNMQKAQACKLVRTVRIMIYGRRARFARSGRLIARIEEGVNMPKMDSFMGICDAYCTIQIGTPEPDKKMFQTMVQYNKMNPMWRETFIFPINFSLRKLKMGVPVMVYLKLYDYDVLGDHDLIGEAEHDVTALAFQALDHCVSVTQAVWMTLFRTRDGKKEMIRGFNRKLTKVRIVVQVVPPAEVEAPKDADNATVSDGQGIETPLAGYDSASAKWKVTTEQGGPVNGLLDDADEEGTGGEPLLPWDSKRIERIPSSGSVPSDAEPEADEDVKDLRDFVHETDQSLDGLLSTENGVSLEAARNHGLEDESEAKLSSGEGTKSPLGNESPLRPYDGRFDQVDELLEAPAPAPAPAPAGGGGTAAGKVPGQGLGGEGRKHSPVVSKTGSSPGKPGSHLTSPNMSNSVKFDKMVADSKQWESNLDMGAVTDKECIKALLTAAKAEEEKHALETEELMGRMAAIESSARRLAALQEQIADSATKVVLMLQEAKGADSPKL